MIETRRLKNVAIFIQTTRKNNYNDYTADL